MCSMATTLSMPSTRANGARAALAAPSLLEAIRQHVARRTRVILSFGRVYVGVEGRGLTALVGDAQRS